MKLRDNGCTMPPAVRERIFDPFFPTRSVGRGMEQGIAIAHDAIVNQHGSTTGVEREPGVGPTFTIRLPIEQRGAAPIAEG